MVLPATMDPSEPLDDTFGALYIGTLISAVIYGIIILQAFHYSMRYQKDMWYTKTTVATLIVFETIHMFLLGSIIYHYVIRYYHDPSKLPYLLWQTSCGTLFITANSAIVQVFYVYRIFKLSQSKLLSAIVLLFVLCQVGINMAWVILSWSMKRYTDIVALVPLTIAANVLTCTADVLIAGSLCVLLHRSKTGYRRSDSLINKLIIFVISTGAFTAIVAIVAFIIMLVLPYTLIYVGLYFCLGRLYTNSCLTALNARSTIDDDIELNPHSITPGTRGTTASSPRNINFRIASETSHEMYGIGQEREATTGDCVATKGHIESDDDSLPKGAGRL